MKGFKYVLSKEISGKPYAVLVSGILLHNLESVASSALALLQLSYNSVAEVYAAEDIFLIRSGSSWIFITKDKCVVIKPKLWCSLTYLYSLKSFICSFGGPYLWLAPLKYDYLKRVASIIDEAGVNS